MAEQAKPFLAGSKEVAAVYDVRPLQVSQWVGRGVVDYTHARIISGSPYWLLSYVRDFGPAAKRARHPDERELEKLVEEQSPGRWARSVDEMPPIVGLTECAELFHTSREALSVIARRGGFVPADYRLSGSPLWLLSTVAGPGVYVGPAQARKLDWAPDPDVLAALQGGTYDGPGSVIVPRGRAAAKSAEG
ncbi:hypothetical protein [Streptomyces beijiangensis]|uniref:Uncharacterized protein n=1 Tax=Streptomyces beijiangensis TaxID=163361 RepID=A0A939FAP0_9ACTN|nr:hypothetical protein [Streptomyces beijiangensis]MBO0514796.1 hypothetical protein [Streptomyces beijiangensis]